MPSRWSAARMSASVVVVCGPQATTRHAGFVGISLKTKNVKNVSVRMRKSPESSLLRRNAAISALASVVERRAQPVADQREAEHGQEERDRRRDLDQGRRLGGRGAKVVRVEVEERSPRRGEEAAPARRAEPQTEVENR